MDYLCGVFNLFENSLNRYENCVMNNMINREFCGQTIGNLWQPWKNDSVRDTKISNKELPTTKWRRDRRLRVSSEYHAQTSLQIANCLRLAAAEQLQQNGNNVGENGPLDMTLTSKPRTPPPPYREPLPGSTYANTLNARPSVITQAPAKREFPVSDSSKGPEKSISMCDTVIDDHFRRSLGDDYMILFSKNKTQSTSPPSSSLENDKENNSIAAAKKIVKQEMYDDNSSEMDEDVVDGFDETSSEMSEKSNNDIDLKRKLEMPKNLIKSPKSSSSSSPSSSTTSTPNQSIELSVDDHFAKALGDTWKKLQEGNNKLMANGSNSSDIKKDTIRSQVVDNVV